METGAGRQMLITAALQIAIGAKQCRKKCNEQTNQGCRQAASLTLRLVLLGGFAMPSPLFSQSATAMDHSESTQTPPELVQAVRGATQKYINVTLLPMPDIIPSLAVSRGQIMAPWGCTT